MGLAVLGSSEYVIAAWHQTLLTIAIVAFCAFFNIFLAARLPITEAIVLVLHIAGVFVIIIPLWVTAPRGNAYDTIFKFTNGGGWDSDGLSYAIGIVPMIGMLIVSTTDIFFAVVSAEQHKLSMRRLIINTLLGLRLLYSHVRGDQRRIQDYPSCRTLVRRRECNHATHRRHHVHFLPRRP